MKFEDANFKTVSRDRRAGVLLHPTSLPNSLPNGDIGHQAYRFIEFLNSHGFKVWQMLPLGPTHDDKSPYQCLSSHAGNPLLISLDWLEDKKLLNREVIDEKLDGDAYRYQCLKQAGDYFYQLDSKEWRTSLIDFNKQHDFWLSDYALFIAFKKKFNNTPWYEWPDDIRHREKKALELARVELDEEVQQVKFEQFIFFTQWKEVRQYAKRHSIELFGDIPIFVARDSADVWADRNNFLMDENGDMDFVAGVPPDAFTDTGQRWGNPLFDWEFMQSDKYQWWKERFKTQLELFDLVRIDHFRGLQACWQIPQQDETAINGEWHDVPGNELLLELFNSYEHLPLVAEDLGVITDEVIALKEKFNLPGMKVLHFAFDGNTHNPHLPHMHSIDDVVYTGTHDNDTTLSWAEDDNNYNKEYFESYLGIENMSVQQRAWALIRAALSSVSFLSVLPMQDLLMLGNSARMNMPGTVGGNWQWRFEWRQVQPEKMTNISQLITLYGR